MREAFAEQLQDKLAVVEQIQLLHCSVHSKRDHQNEMSFSVNEVFSRISNHYMSV